MLVHVYQIALIYSALLLKFAQHLVDSFNGEFRSAGRFWVALLWAEILALTQGAPDPSPKVTSFTPH